MQKVTATALLLSTLASQALAVAQYGAAAAADSSSTMMMMSSSTMMAGAATTTMSGAMATHTVQVGDTNGNNVYVPDSVTAAMGDMLEFHFNGNKAHDVVSGSFSSPCMDDSMVYSGYPSDSDVFQMMVNDTTPMWLYCSTPTHCQGGMAMVVNQAATGSKTLAAYMSAASGTSSSNAPASVMGGMVMAMSAVMSSGSSMMSGSATATMSAMASASSMAMSGAVETIRGSLTNIALAVGVPALVWWME